MIHYVEGFFLNLYKRHQPDFVLYYFREVKVILLIMNDLPDLKQCCSCIIT